MSNITERWIHNIYSQYPFLSCKGTKSGTVGGGVFRQEGADRRDSSSSLEYLRTCPLQSLDNILKLKNKTVKFSF